jgi:hypothetical protein
MERIWWCHVKSSAKETPELGDSEVLMRQIVEEMTAMQNVCITGEMAI